MARRRIKIGRTRMRLMNSSELTSFSVEVDELAEVDVAIAVDLVDHGGDLVGDLVAGLHRPRWLRLWPPSAKLGGAEELQLLAPTAEIGGEKELRLWVSTTELGGAEEAISDPLMEFWKGFGKML
ncbi:hypothetical protein RHMOL_Rhmol01G0166700 [Rhododendron molle]|uniref:Uncharacterized protein n=1 Tax=Rhododendron molle TaxID=49168 RepID=A0ACC0Q573_RHOML|nr:hypothetical protein RHMOL_Rhmol01G0166700 [Rhododendron molle]